MRNLFTVLLFALFCVSCVSPTHVGLPSDREATRLMVGNWVILSQPGIVNGGNTFKSDETFSSNATFSTPTGQITINVEGKWRIQHGIFITEITKSSHPMFVPVGLITRDMLVFVNKVEYRYCTDKGEERGCLRAPN